VARDAVVIKPREDKDAITFSGQQVGPVKYQIANLTIRANDPDLNQENAVVFNFDLGIDPPPNPPLASEIVFDNVWVSLDGGGMRWIQSTDKSGRRDTSRSYNSSG